MIPPARSRFKPSDKVVCIDRDLFGPQWDPDPSLPVYGRTYVVRGTIGGRVVLVGLENDDINELDEPEYGWFDCFFEHLHVVQEQNRLKRERGEI